MAALEPSEKKALSAQLRVLSAFSAHDPHMAVYAAKTILEVALHDEPGGRENYTLTELAEAVGIPQPTMTRVLRTLEAGDDKQGPKEGLGLLSSYADPTNYRAKRIKLSRQGTTLVKNILRIAGA